MADLGAIDEDVPFDDGVADALIAACDGAAAKIEGQAGSRSSYVATASADFQGYFSRLFASNASVASADGTELAARLRQVATGARRLKSEAAKEQQRRQTARDWKREQDNRNIFEKGVDWAFGEDDPPVGPPAAEPTIPVSAAPTGHRETPSPGSGGGSDATSAARPSDLRSFASGSAELNQALSGLPASLRAKYSDFAESCRWGRLSASSVFTGFDKWLSANDNDVSWAGTIAAAFDAAGGSGSVNSVANSALAAALNAAGINATRQDLTIDPPQAYGHPPTTGYAMDPVNTSTGNFVETETDLGFSGAAAGLTLQRTYNSADQGGGAFGRGWTSVVESRIELSDEGASVVLPDGRRILFARLGSGWDRADGENLWLTAEDDSLVMSDNDGRRWEFSRAGVWRSSSRGAGTRVSAVRDAAGRLVKLAHERGRFIDLVWSGERLIEAGASDGRGVRYSYDAAGRLLSAAGPAGTRSYRWNDADLMEAVIDGDGVAEAENSYDDQRRVATQRTPFGRLTRFAYLPGRVTVVSDADGTRSNTWIADRRGRLVGVVDSDEQRQAMSYDRNGNVVSVTERDGSVTVHSYDDRGRRVRTVTPSGADITYGHDVQDRVTTVVAESGAITSLEYADDDRNPSLVVDPEGGRTELEWSDGLLRRIGDPTGVELRYDYDAHGDLVATTDADGQVARLERDEIGRVVAAVTPSGNRTSYAFDDRGYLVSRRDPDGAIWRYEHSAAGRLTAMVDPTGGRTTVEHGPHGRATTKIDPLGRASTHRFDDLGNLIGAGLPDGSAWQFGYDGLSRLTEIVDPGGHQWRRDYNAAGELTAVIAPDGVRRSLSADRATGSVETDDGLARSGFAFDPLGRPISETGPDGSAALTSYDLCGRPVEQVDAEGGLTLLRRDAAGRVVERITPAGAGTRYEYDRCGRLSAVIDPLGGRTRLVYDVDGRLVQRILPTGESARYEYDRAGRVVARSEPGRGTARIGYDAAGRVVRIADSWFGRRRFRYDAAGQLVEAVNGNGGVTRYEYDLNGRMITIIDPLGGVTTRRYDANDHLLAQTDPLGRTTTAGYDVAGRQLWQQDPEGHRTEWTHDASGRVASTVVDGRTVSEISRDLRARTVTITDRTDPGNVCTHVLGWNRRDQLTSRTRNGAGLSWEYDADGRRTAMVAPDGSRTNYAHDRAGRLIAVDHPLLGRADFDYDASGRLVQASAGQQLQSWQYADGRLSAHTVIDADGGSTLTTIERDDAGRIVALRTAGQVARFDHDEACQLIEARLADAHGGMRVSRWRYDPAGRLVAETVDTAAGTRYREHHYDAAGQLTETDDSAVGRTEYAYDLAGRRIRASAADGAGREFSWTASGWLSGITDHAADGRRRRTGLHVDATGELASADDAAVWWDTAAGGLSSLVQIGDVPALSPGGGFNGLADDWRPSGWRPGRDADLADPWMLADPAADPLSAGSGAGAGTGLSGSLGIGAGGELTVAGLEWMGARAYDPSTRGFLSTDPLAAIPGAGWAANPYSYAGNDPLHALDPTGLRPATDADLQAYRDAHNGIGDEIGNWVSNNWEYLAGGAMVIGGGILMATGVGGPVGMALVSAGADTIIQKATTGQVNWGQVAVSGVAGGIGFGVGGALAKTGVTGVKAAVTAGAVEGATGGLGTYAVTTPTGQLTPGGALQAMTGGAVFGAAGGAAGFGLTRARGALGAAKPTPEPFMPPNTGGLSDDMAQTFSGGRYTPGTLPEDTILYRAGKPDAPLGQFFSRERPVGVTQTRIDKAIPEVWPDGNPAPLETGYAIKLPAGTPTYTGEVANQGGLYMGGTEQIVVQRPWEIPGVEVVDSWPLH